MYDTAGSQVGCMNASGEGLAAPDLQEAVAWYRKVTLGFPLDASSTR